MEQILNMLRSLIPENFDYVSFLKIAGLLLIGSLLFSLLGRLIFGKKSVLNQSVSSAIGILFIYAVTVVIYSYQIDLGFLTAPLPFIKLTNGYLLIFNLLSAEFAVICNHLLNMIILAFLVNLANTLLPTGKKLIPWLFFRVLSVAVGMLLFAGAVYLMNTFLPADFMKWAPVIVLGVLVLSLLTGALKVIFGAFLTTVNPLIGILYTFFFASVVGKQLSKAILTTLIMTALVAGLNYLGVFSLFIGTAALAAYIPLLLVLLVLWYIVGHLL